MTGETVLLVVGRRRFRGISRIEPRPPPTISPQHVAGVAVLAVLHHHEPALQGPSVTDRPRRHRSRRGLVDLFDQYRSIREVAAGAERSDRARCRIDIVKLAGAVGTAPSLFRVNCFSDLRRSVVRLGYSVDCTLESVFVRAANYVLSPT